MALLDKKTRNLLGAICTPGSFSFLVLRMMFLTYCLHAVLLAWNVLPATLPGFDPTCPGGHTPQVVIYSCRVLTSTLNGLNVFFHSFIFYCSFQGEKESEREPLFWVSPLPHISLSCIILRDRISEVVRSLLKGRHEKWGTKPQYLYRIFV